MTPIIRLEHYINAKQVGKGLVPLDCWNSDSWRDSMFFASVSCIIFCRAFFNTNFALSSLSATEVFNVSFSLRRISASSCELVTCESQKQFNQYVISWTMLPAFYTETGLTIIWLIQSSVYFLVLFRPDIFISFLYTYSWLYRNVQHLWHHNTSTQGLQRTVLKILHEKFSKKFLRRKEKIKLWAQLYYMGQPSKLTFSTAFLRYFHVLWWSEHKNPTTFLNLVSLILEKN